MPPRPLPAELAALPRMAWMECIVAEPDWPLIVLWTWPGIPREHPDSDTSGNRGASLGYVQGCTQVEITKYAWSGSDRDYYVWVKADAAEGWVGVQQIAFKKTW
ncbi:MAG: hypothetical protein HZB53_21550 [Chloroflexi bacterium]|nr:hypothetical protein [Chloroflexota bacterium]